MSEVLMRTTDFRPEAQRAMEYLVNRFGDLMHLGALQEAKVVCVDKVGGVRAPRVPSTGRGLTLPAHGSAIGKALLAHCPREEVTLYFREHIPALTPNTITSLDVLHEDLTVVRERGFALDLEEMMLGLCCVAAPIRDRTGEVVAAMSFSVPAYRFEQGRDRYVAAIVQASHSVSENIGYFS
ncbi:MAG: IclR family transcriptional regulator [Rubrobacteraceae bacterium]